MMSSYASVSMSTFWYWLLIARSARMCSFACLPGTALHGRRVLALQTGRHLFLNHFEDGVDHGFHFVGKSESEGAVARLHLYDNSVLGETLPVSDNRQG